MSSSNGGEDSDPFNYGNEGGDAGEDWSAENEDALEQALDADIQSQLQADLSEADLSNGGFAFVESLQSQLEALTAQLQPPQAPLAGNGSSSGSSSSSSSSPVVSGGGGQLFVQGTTLDPGSNSFHEGSAGSNNNNDNNTDHNNDGSNSSSSSNSSSNNSNNNTSGVASGNAEGNESTGEHQNEQAPDSEAVGTFLEFTGSTDRDRARRYLAAAGGQLEQAVNLFLSGTPLEMLEAPLRAARSRNMRTRARGLGPNFLPTFQANASGGGSSGSGGGGVEDLQGLNSADAAAADASWVLRMAGARNMGEMETTLLGLSGADLSAMISGGGGSGAWQGLYGPLSSNKILDDSQRAKAHLVALRAGNWDKAPEVGASCLRSPELAEMYLENGVCRVIAAGLPMAICAGEDGYAVRLLQLVECIMRLVCDGHADCVSHCGWWFIPARRSSSRRLARNSFTEIFLERIVPEDDVEGLRQLWLMENFDPSWRDRKTEAEMLSCTLHQGCSLEMLEVLVDPVNGCRANVNPDPDRLGSLASPLVVAGRATGFSRYWRRQRAAKSNRESDNEGSDRSQSDRSRSSETDFVLRTGDLALMRPSRLGETRPFRLRELAGDGSAGSSAHPRRERGSDGADDIEASSREAEQNDPEFIEAREQWSRAAVEILLDSGACVDEEVMDKLDSMTKSARELITAERAGTRVSTRLQKRADAGGSISEEVVARWWQKDARRFFRALLRTIALTKHASTMHRAMEILGMMVKRFRPKPHSDAVNILGKIEYDRLLQLLQSVFAPENDDTTSLVLIVDMTEALLERTQQEDPIPLDADTKVLGIHAQLCLSLCRYGIARRLRDLRAPGKPQLEGAAAKVVEHISTCIVDELGLTEETLLGKSAALLDVCRRLREGDESVLEHLVWMMGQSRARSSRKKKRRKRRLMSRGLFGYDHTGSLENLHGAGRDNEDRDAVVVHGVHDEEDDDADLMDEFDLDADLSDEDDDENEGDHEDENDEYEQGEESPTAEDLRPPEALGVPDSPLIRMYGEEGITPFEFEQSGLPSALLHFLMARDLDGEQATSLTDSQQTIADVRQARMHALLAAMPPPVVGKDVDEEDDHMGAAGAKTAAVAGAAGPGDGGISDAPSSAVAEDDKNSDHGDAEANTGNERDLVRETSLTNLGRQASMTLESVQNLATTTLDTIDPPGVTNKVDASTFAASALFRLIRKLQTVLTVHATHNFPVLAHDAVASSGGVRALVNPIKLHLRKNAELDQASTIYPHTPELVVQVLPLTPLQELQRQVLRGVRLVEPRYVSYCTRLVGRKLFHRRSVSQTGTNRGPGGSDTNQNYSSLVSPDSVRRSPAASAMSPGHFGAVGRGARTPRTPGTVTPGQATGAADGGEVYKVALVLRYDPVTGAHLLQDMSARTLNKKANKRWFILALRDYQVLERVFDPPAHGSASLAPVLRPLGDAVREQEEGGGRSRMDSTSSACMTHGAKFRQGDEVAVWWRGSDALRPGWRRASVLEVRPVRVNRAQGVGPENAFEYDVSYLEPGLLEDDVIRVGDRVKLIDDAAELERLASGHGGFMSDMPRYCGNVGRAVAVNGSEVKVDGLGNYTYNAKALIKVTANADASRRGSSAGDGEGKDAAAPEAESNVPQRRLCLVGGVEAFEERHVFSVYLVPGPNSVVARARHDAESSGSDATRAQSQAAREEHSFKLNDRIEGRYAGKSRYYKGRIARVNADGTYDIAYDDGDSERGVKPSLVCHIGQGPGKVVSFDFRKVFPNSAGRALFDALRREDAVLQTEYNFVTRGFEHQPDFYSKFSALLEDTGEGVFAQFQTRRQAEILFDRVQACGNLSRVRNSSPSVPGSSDGARRDRVVTAQVDVLPEAPIPVVVERDIAAAFEHLRSRQGGRVKHRHEPPPRPGQRAQVSLLPDDFLDPDTRNEEEGPAEAAAQKRVEPGRWISATIVAHRPAPSSDGEDEPSDAQRARRERSTSTSSTNTSGSNQITGGAVDGPTSPEGERVKQLLTCVLDDGRVVWDIPDTRTRLAQRTSRVFPFKSKERQGANDDLTDLDDDPSLAPAPSSNKSLRGPDVQEPVHLSRQFTAFGYSTSYKRIQFSQGADEDGDEDSLGVAVFDDDLDGDFDSAADGTAGDEEDDDAIFAQGPPRITVDFLLRKRPKRKSAEDEEHAESSEASEALQAVTFGDENANEKGQAVQVPILAQHNMEISMFQALFQLQNLGAASERDWVHWEQEYYLEWRVRCLFPGDDDYDVSQPRILQRLPWGTPRALAYDLTWNKELTLTYFVNSLRSIVPDLRDWAVRNKLSDVVRCIDGHHVGESESSDEKRVERMVNWAAICAAYSQLCQRPLMSQSDTPVSPAVSPIRSPTLMRRDLLAMKVISGSGNDMAEGARAGNSSSSSIQSPQDALPLAAPVPSEMLPHVNNAAVAHPAETLAQGTGAEEGEIEAGMAEVVALLEECGIDANVPGLRDTLMLLHLLFSHLVPFDEGADPLAAAFGKSLPWRSDTLSDLLLDQLSDPLAIATRCFPRWVALMPREFSFLFRRNVRELHFRTTALGVSRAVAWLQDEITGYNAKKKQLAHVTLEISAMFKGVPDMVRFEQLQELSDRLEDEIRAIEQEHCIGQLHQDLVKVNRAELLRDAELLMKQHMHQRSELVVQFLDETGAGEGVTVDFYSSVSERLQLLDENRRIPLWANPAGADKPARESSKFDGDDAEEDATDASAEKDAEENAGGDSADREVHLLAPTGLFPQPLLAMGSVDGGSGGNPVALQPLSVVTNARLPASKGASLSRSAGAVGTSNMPGDQADMPVEDLSKSNVVKPEQTLSAKVELSEGKEDEASIKFDDDVDTNRDNIDEILRAARTQNMRVLRRFRFLGRIMAKALLDGMNVPLPLSSEFFMLIQQRQRGMRDALLPISALSLFEGGAGLGDEGTGGDIAAQSSGGLVQRLYALHEAGDKGAIEELLEAVELYFVDPAQRLGVLEHSTFAGASSSAKSTSMSSASSGSLPKASSSVAADAATAAIEAGGGASRDLSSAFETLDVPGKGASSAELVAYAERASKLGKSQGEIDAALGAAGHAKLQRWKAIKASQKTRVQIKLARAERDEKRRAELAVATELVPGGATRRVTAANLGDYLQLVLTWWLGNGVASQADSFCEGLRDVLGTTGRDALIFNFSHSELRRMLCGKEEILWKEEDPLLGCIVPMQGYTRQSPPIQMLVRCLKEMNMSERAQFLSFVTAQPRVPLSGLPQIKVYPPLMERIPGIVLRVQTEVDRGFEVGDSVTLSPDYHAFDDAADGPLTPGEVAVVTNVDGRVRVADWWYSTRALRLVRTEDGRRASAIGREHAESSGTTRKNWFLPGDEIGSIKARAKIAEWDPDTWTLTFDASVPMDIRRAFKAGHSIQRVSTAPSESGASDANEEPVREPLSKMPPLCVDHLVEQPQAIQMRPYLRPKATTCAKTLYLPREYDSWQHMLETFKSGAFQDAKLGGIHEDARS
ncbi:E3 ubiquitin-protein ligase TRIP12 [Hondaea fermentalgiana]|uniref:E3 ubiquitin-protein ligase TRIP12 n=1 Tax=Hondaea fermentalgiana TaxID=2315210 RepID=A0A2R5FYW0_9STRA|nr:E3 ubiquitin-protein ligase TRIP12 [Hondaea fermentalgiana]|eukprot:GBG23942.1 E3 ubiquitin-protein ligase TRIP12 [Hondaea fermentalgiana]